MSKTKTDIGEVQFSSQAFPSEEGMKRWENLDPASRRAVVVRDEQQGFDSGVAPAETIEERLARVRAALVPCAMRSAAKPRQSSTTSSATPMPVTGVVEKCQDTPT